MRAILDMQALAPNPHAQAAIMGGFGVVAVYGLWRDREQHGRSYPLMLGAAGVVILLIALYIRYDARAEVMAYVLLIGGALLNQTAMLGRLYDTVLRQAKQIQEFNHSLEDKVQRQVREIDRLSRLKDFLAPSVAELVVREDRENLLHSHRRYIACLFCDIRNFTSVSERLEPEETIALLQSYHERAGELIFRRSGTIGYRAGDGLMVFFNDPVPCERPVLEAVRLALEIREAWQELRGPWQRLGHSVGIGIGVASGYTTLGLMGNRGRTDYTAIGNAVNIASRLCDEAGESEILLDSRAYSDVEDEIEATASESRSLKGISEPVPVFTLSSLRSDGRENSSAAGRG